MHERLREFDFRQNVERELNKLKGHGFKWSIDSEEFDIDTDDISEFCDFYLAHDCEAVSYTHLVF